MTRIGLLIALVAAVAVSEPAIGEELIDPDGLSKIMREMGGQENERAPGVAPESKPERAPGITSGIASSQDVLLDGVRGQLRPVRHTVLSAGFNGRIDEISATVGDVVEEGDVLVRMDCDEMKADRAAMFARESAAAARYDVNRKLAAVNNVSGLEVELSRAELAVARAESRRVAARMAYCEIKAPFTGTLTAKHVQAFQHVQAGEPVLDLVNNTELRVEVVVPSTWLVKLRPNHPFVLHVEEMDRMIAGRVLHSAGRVDPVSQTVLLIGLLSERPEGVMAGMSGSVVLQGADATQ